MYARSEPNVEKVLIGELHLTSKIIRSMFGDRELFFKHEDGKFDLDLKPEWKSAFPYLDL